MVNTNVIKGLIIGKYGTIKSFANEIGVNSCVLSMYLNNTRTITYEVMQKLVGMLEIDGPMIKSIFFADSVASCEHSK